MAQVVLKLTVSSRLAVNLHAAILLPSFPRARMTDSSYHAQHLEPVVNERRISQAVVTHVL